MRASSARIVSASVASMPMPALPRAVGTAMHVEGAAVAGDDGRQPRPRRSFCASWARKISVAGGAVEQLDAALDRLGGVLGLDRARIGGVDEHELAGIVARPDRRGQRVDQRAQRRGVVDQLLVAQLQLGQLALGAAHVAQPQDGAAADDLALGLDQPAGERRHRASRSSRRGRAAHRPSAPSSAPGRARARCRTRARGAAHRSWSPARDRR